MGDIIKGFKKNRKYIQQKSRIRACMYLWLQRNDRIFNGRYTNAFCLALKIHHYMLLWIGMNAPIQDKLPSITHQDVRRRLELHI